MNIPKISEHKGSRWIVLLALAVATFISTLDTSIVNVALAPIASDFHVQVDKLEWIVVTYALPLVALLPTSGRISDLLGRTRVFTWGFLAFIGGSLLCSLAWNLPSLAIFRAAQGIGAAMLQGNGQAIIAASFPPNERGQAFGIMGATVSAGVIAGPVVGGLLTAWLGWRSIFWVNVPIGIAGFALGRMFLPADPKSESREFDYLGAILFALGAIAFITGLSHAAGNPWLSLTVGGLMLVGAIILAVFVWWEKRAPEPLMPPIIFASPGVVAGMSAAMFIFSTGFTSNFLTPYVMQNALNFSVRTAGIAMTAPPIAMIIVSPISGYLSDRFGPRLFTVAGILSAATGLFLLSGVSPDWQLSDWYWRLLFLGVGWGMFNSPNTSTIMSAVPPQVAGVTGGLNATVRNTANTVAVALAASMFTWITAGSTAVSAYLTGYHKTLLLAAGLAVFGIVPAFLRQVPPRQY